jgi:hemolysin activation/secretion protein
LGSVGVRPATARAGDGLAGRDLGHGAQLALVAATSALCLAWPGVSLAQLSPNPAQTAPAQPSREELNPAARIEPAPAHERELFAQEPAGPCPLRSSTLTFTLKSVDFRGATALSAAQLQAAYADAIGQKIAVSAICDIRDHAATLLFNRGVLARVNIPPQSIADGHLVLEVIEAHVVNVRVRGDAGRAQTAVERYLDKLRGMTPFDMRKAQRYLLLASDIPGVQVRAAVRPSTNGERGAVDLDITVTAQPVNLTANAQNLESKAIGRWGGLLRLDVNSLTDFGDRTSVVGYHTLDNGEQGVIQLLEEGRIGGEGLIARGSLVYGETRPGGPIASSHLKSSSFVAEAELAYPLVRLRRRNLNLAAGFDDVDESTDASGQLLFRDKLRVFYARMDGDDRVDVLSRVVQFSGSLSYRHGVDGLGASTPGSDTLTRPLSKPDAWLVRGSGRAATTLFGALQFSNQVQAQYSPDQLFDYEQIALGDLTIGRGYDPAVVLGDSGVSDASELRYGPVPLRPQLLAQPYVFYDVGYVHDVGTAVVKNRTLTSAGLGVLFRIANRLTADVAYAKPFQAPLPGQPRPTPRLLVNLTAAVF